MPGERLPRSCQTRSNSGKGQWLDRSASLFDIQQVSPSSVCRRAAAAGFPPSKGGGHAYGLLHHCKQGNLARKPEVVTETCSSPILRTAPPHPHSPRPTSVRLPLPPTVGPHVSAAQQQSRVTWHSRRQNRSWRTGRGALHCPPPTLTSGHGEQQVETPQLGLPHCPPCSLENPQGTRVPRRAVPWAQWKSTAPLDIAQSGWGPL